MKVTNLCSGSKGNCTLLQSDNTTILVDIGISCKRLEQVLAQFNLSAKNIDAILLTHEHIDHISGLNTFAKKYNDVHIFVNALCWQKIVARAESAASLGNVHFFEYVVPFSVGDFTALAIENEHDSVSCASFIISAGGGKVGIATDLGRVTDRLIDYLGGCKVVFLECNHDPKMLTNCGYGYMQQQRIASSHGHLSNEQCALAAVRLVAKQTKVLVLSHISSHSNLPEVAYSHVANAISASGGAATILIAWQDRPSKTITLL